MQEGVAPFGDPRIKACSRLPKAFRSVPRPSSPLGAKASTRCPCFPRPPPATTTPCTPPSLRLGGDPARQRTAPTKRAEDAAAAAGKANSSVNYNYKLVPTAPPREREQAASIPMPNMRPAADGRRGQARMTCRRPPHHDAWQGSLLPCPHDGHLVTTSRCPRNMRRRHRPNRAGGAQTGRLASGGRARPGPRRPHLPNGEARPGGPGPT